MDGFGLLLCRTVRGGKVGARWSKDSSGMRSTLRKVARTDTKTWKHSMQAG